MTVHGVEGTEGAEGTAFRAWHLVGLGSIAAAVLIAVAPETYRAVPLILQDSASYLEWTVGRTPGYPLFLQGVRVFSPSLTLLGPLQFVMFAAATCWFSHVLEQFLGSRIASAAYGLAIVLHPQIVSYTQTVLPESIFLSVLLLLLASAMRAISKPTIAGWSTRAGALAGLLILLKPAAYGFVPAVALLPWLTPRNNRIRAGLAGATGAGAVLLAGIVLTFARTGVWATQSYGGYALIGITGAFVEPDDVPAYADLIASVNAEQQGLRAALARTPSLDVHHFLSAIAYHTVHSAWIARLERRVQAEGVAARDSDAAFVRLNGIAMEISSRAIRRHPRAYTRHVLTHLYALWMVPFVRSPAQAEAVDRQIDALASEIPGSLSERPIYRRVPAPVAFVFRFAMAIALTVSIVALVPLAIWRQLTVWRMLLVTSVLVHGYFLLVAVSQPGLPRYALMMWPAIVLMLLLAARAIGAAARRGPTNGQVTSPGG